MLIHEAAVERCYVSIWSSEHFLHLRFCHVDTYAGWTMLSGFASTDNFWSKQTFAVTGGVPAMELALILGLHGSHACSGEQGRFQLTSCAWFVSNREEARWIFFVCVCGLGACCCLLALHCMWREAEEGDGLRDSRAGVNLKIRFNCASHLVYFLLHISLFQSFNIESHK